MSTQSDLADDPTTSVNPLVDWRPPSVETEGHQTESLDGAPRLGAVVAAAICAILAGFGLLTAPQTGWVGGVIGFPGTTMLAWWMAPNVVGATRKDAVAVAAKLAVGAILVADALVVSILVLATAIASGSTSGGGTVGLLSGAITALVGAVGFGIFVFLVGAVVVGIPIASVVLPAALIWAAVVRLLAGRGWAR